MSILLDSVAHPPLINHETDGMVALVSQIEDGSTKPAVTGYRTLHVLVYPSRLFAAHWSLWLPYSDANGGEAGVGDRIHATGDCLNGFQYEYLVGENVKEDNRRPTAFPIGHVLIQHLSGKVAVGSDMDLAAHNTFDQVCQQVPVPGPSLNRVVPGGAAGTTPNKLEIKDCQWWVKQAIAHLVEANILFPLEEGGSAMDTPGTRVDMLPKH